MKQGSNKRLANVKTRQETGFEYVKQQLAPETPFGKKNLDELRPYFPGEEEELREELEKVSRMVKFLETHEKEAGVIAQAFMMIKDLTYTLERSHHSILSVVELFELKTMLLAMDSLSKVMAEGADIPSEYKLEYTEDLLDMLDPRKDRLNTFYIYDDFSDALRELRAEKHDLEVKIRKGQKARRNEIQKETGIMLTPKFDVIVPKQSEELAKAREIPDLEQISEDYGSVTFKLAISGDLLGPAKELEDLEGEIEAEEEKVRKELTMRVAKKEPFLTENCKRIGLLDLAIAKAGHALKRGLVKPEIADDHVIRIEDGVHLQVEDVLRNKGKEYHPISIELEEGVTCITGANMGGKTISLKLTGLIPMMAQYGLFVPAKKAVIGLSDYMQLLVGDSQSLERGLSSFGSEMEELKEMLDRSRDRSLLLIDEIASGTNPIEGLALTRSIMDHLEKKPYISLITTHFEAMIEEKDIKNLQVRGLQNADFRKLDSELRLANRKERINIIGKYMDYSLYEVADDREIPKDALNIAKMLGLPEEIIEGARKYIK